VSEAIVGSAGLTVSALARRVGVGADTVRNYERAEFFRSALWPLWSCLRHELQWQIGRWRGGGEHNRCNASWPMKANRVKITPSAPAISDCSQELSRRISPITASLNAVSKPAKRNRTNARGPCSPRLRSACQRQAGVWGHSVALGACRRRSSADPTTGARARCRRPPWPSRQGSGPR